MPRVYAESWLCTRYIFQLRDGYLENSTEGLKKELSTIDQSIDKLYKSLGTGGILLVIFTGSPNSVPLDKRSNGILRVGICGQKIGKPR